MYFQNSSEIGIGNVIGSNISNILLVLGLILLFLCLFLGTFLLILGEALGMRMLGLVLLFLHVIFLLFFAVFVFLCL